MPEDILRLVELILIAVCITEIVVLLKYVKLIKIVWEGDDHYILFFCCFFFLTRVYFIRIFRLKYPEFSEYDNVLEAKIFFRTIFAC